MQRWSTAQLIPHSRVHSVPLGRFQQLSPIEREDRPAIPLSPSPVVYFPLPAMVLPAESTLEVDSWPRGPPPVIFFHRSGLPSDWRKIEPRTRRRMTHFEPLPFQRAPAKQFAPVLQDVRSCSWRSRRWTA
uniref:(northern house mosquito) hypothetical protein n=1 Tax=Culex pipiens TaxID=7175 RepID=A0A8D7ZYI1_CULPI